MKELLRFLATYAAGIYLILGVVVIISLQRFITAWLRNRKARFGMEREIFQNQIRSSLSVLGLAIIFIITQYLLVSVLLVKFPNIMLLSTPTMVIDSTNVALTQKAGAISTPQGSELTQTAIAVTGCIPGQLEWTFPKAGDTVGGSVELKGTVNIPNQGFYKYEYQRQGQEEWIPIAAGNKPSLVDEVLGGVWNTAQLTPGGYFLQLVVSDNANNLLKPCMIEVKVNPE